MAKALSTPFRVLEPKADWTTLAAPMCGTRGDDTVEMDVTAGREALLVDTQEAIARRDGKLSRRK